MGRLAMVSSFILCLLPGWALAGQASASFTAGITIGGAAHSPPRVTAIKTYTWGQPQCQ